MSNPTPHLYDNSCLNCINNGFFWYNNNCRDYYNNTNDITLATHNNGTATCPILSNTTIINANISEQELDNLAGNATAEETQQDNIEAISILQQMEKDAYKQLETGIANNTLSAEEETQLMKNISEYSALRINLYKQLNQSLIFYKNNINSTKNTIREQLIAIQIVEAELKSSAIKLQEVNNDNNSKVRMVEINRYYGEKYADHTIFMKYFILVTILILIVYVLYKKYYISKTIYTILMGIIVIFILLKMVPLYYRMIFRSNMNYEEYSFPISNIMTGSVNSSTTTTMSATDPWLNNELTAISNCVNDIADANTTSTTSTSTSSTTST
jgi:VIT1/CCC1 family predicted Fe2+/Mn2+ transporter